MPARARQVGRGGDRGGPVAAGRRDRGHVAHRDLDDVVGRGDHGQGLVVEPDPRLPGHDGDRRGHRAGGAHRCLDLAGDPQVVRPRQPVADDRRLQSDDRPPAAQGGGHLVGHMQGGGQGRVPRLGRLFHAGQASATIGG